MDYRTLFDNIHHRPGLYGLDGSYAQFCVFVDGLDYGNDRALLTGFRQWLVTRAGKGNNLTWRALVLHLAFPGGEQSPRPAADPADSAQANQTAVDLLFALLAEFFDLQAEHDGMVKIFDGYLAWLRTQSWHQHTT